MKTVRSMTAVVESTNSMTLVKRAPVAKQDKKPADKEPKK